MTLQERLAMTQGQDNGMDIILGGILLPPSRERCRSPQRRWWVQEQPPPRCGRAAPTTRHWWTASAAAAFGRRHGAA